MGVRTGFSSRNRSCIVGFILLVVLVILIPLAVLKAITQQNPTRNVTGSSVPAGTTARGSGSTNGSKSTVGSSAIRHFEYVFPYVAMYLYDMTSGHKPCTAITWPANEAA